MPVLSSDVTFKYKDTGIVLNSDPAAPFVDIDTITGFDSPNFRETTRDHEGVDGGFLDAEFEKSREIVLSGTAYGASSSALMAYLDTLKENFAPTTQPYPFYFLMGSIGERVLFAKSRGVAYSITSVYRTGQTPIQFKLTAEDPAMYDSTLQSINIPLGATINTGIGFSLGFSFGFGGVTGSGDGGIITNGGNRPATAILTISGGTGVQDPVIINDTLSRTLGFTGLTLSSTDVLTIDLRNRTVLLNGENRRSALTTPQWFLLAKGDNLIRYRSAVTGTGSLLNVAWRNAWR